METFQPTKVQQQDAQTIDHQNISNISSSQLLSASDRATSFEIVHCNTHLLTFPAALSQNDTQ